MAKGKTDGRQERLLIKVIMPKQGVERKVSGGGGKGNGKTVAVNTVAQSTCDKHEKRNPTPNPTQSDTRLLWGFDD